jgi:hypothetical protein
MTKRRKIKFTNHGLGVALDNLKREGYYGDLAIGTPNNTDNKQNLKYFKTKVANHSS